MTTSSESSSKNSFQVSSRFLSLQTILLYVYCTDYYQLKKQERREHREKKKKIGANKMLAKVDKKALNFEKL
jgi:hypothetical protein